MRDIENKWLEYARLHDKEWKHYEGGCGCPSCRKYREDFDQWCKEQPMALQEELTKKLSEVEITLEQADEMIEDAEKRKQLGQFP